MEFYDVVVIGGGPIGSTVANELAEKGVSVLVIERKSEVGYPNHCSGMVSTEFPEVVHFPSSLITNNIHGATVYSASQSTFSFKRERSFAIVIDRINFDRYLYSKATENGASFLFGGNVSSFERTGDGIKLFVDKQAERISLSSKMVVVATGATSSVKKMFGFDDFAGREIYTIQSETFFSSQDPSMVDILMDNSVSHNWFSWVIPVSATKARIGLGTDRRENLKSLTMTLSDKFLPLKGQNISYENPVVWSIPTGLIKESVKDNVLLVGDSARQVKPFSGGGLYTGILSARFAAHVILEALANNDFSKGFLQKYERRWKSTVGKEIRLELFMRDVYTTLTDDDKDSIIKNLNRDSMEQVIQNYGVIDKPWKAGFRIILASKTPYYYLRRKITLFSK
ncbi:MAG: NAD(P)/FAD-dependent oxidoreductase [Caldisericaceae bacterium]